jgi:thiamine-monophosphate kinase
VADTPLRETDEFELIERFFARPATHGAGPLPLLAIGDDAALIPGPDGQSWAVAADTLVEGVHFPAQSDPRCIAARALRVNLSDMAAMGARADFFTLCLTLPQADLQWLEEFASVMQAEADRFGCRLIGGDTTAGPLSISIQMLGSVPPSEAILRNGAAAGDLVAVTGTLGDAAAHVAEQFRPGTWFAQRFWHPEPRLAFAAAVRSLVSAGIDISDGLYADLGHLARSSGLAAVLDLDWLPLSSALRETFAPQVARELALTGGDDYELCLAVPEPCWPEVQEIAAEQAVPLTLVGRLAAGSGVKCVDAQGEVAPPERGGYRHF